MEAKKRVEISMLGEDRIEFRSANKWAKKVVAWAKACPLDGVYSK